MFTRVKKEWKFFGGGRRVNIARLGQIEIKDTNENGKSGTNTVSV